MKDTRSQMSSGNAPNALSSFYASLRSALNGRPPDAQRPISRTKLVQRLIKDEPSLAKCLLIGISRQSLKTVANCFLEDICAPRVIYVLTALIFC